MLEDAGVSVLLTQNNLLAELPETTAQVICLDTQAATIAKRPQQNPTQTAEPDNLVYVIYTSGSTGKPKGVALGHGAVVNLIFAQTKVFGICNGERILQWSSINFDASVEQIFLALTTGAQLVLFPNTIVSNPTRVKQLIDSQQITHFHSVPSFLAQVLSTVASSLKRVISGGDVCPVGTAKAWMKQCRFYNTYGPTETTVTAIGHLLTFVGSSLNIPIGKPISNTRAYIIGLQQQPVPLGAPGELYIGGVGVARGYLKRPAVTAEKFLPDFTKNAVGKRLYRTGDLARYLPDGNIEFLGRIDHQVKIRGYRIELGEIESVLGQHSAVQEAVVVAQEAPSGDKWLAAYVVAEGDQPPAISELREFLNVKLPEYMVPSAFVFLDKLQLTPNGKVDRKALPAPESRELLSDTSYQAPRSPIEEALVEMWMELLGLDRVGIHDDFFQLGGHSLLATQLVARMRQSFQAEISLRSIFEAPTLAGLAEQVEQALAGDDRPTTTPITSTSRDGNLSLSFAQQRLWYLDQLDPSTSTYNVPLAYRLQGSLNIEVLEQSLNQLIERHEVLRTTFSSIDGTPAQVIHPSSSIAITTVDLSDLPQAEREQRCEQSVHTETQLPFDLQQGPLLRALVVRLSEDAYVFMLTIHHIVCDAWSIGILFRELVEVYQARLQGQAPQLPELEIQYADFAHWQREWMQGAELTRQLSYWKEQLEELPTLQLPTDHPRPSFFTHRGAIESAVLSQDISAELKELSNSEGATLFMTLLVAFQTLLCRYSSQSDIAVGTPIANRNRSETEGLIGFFVNTLVLRTDLSENPSFRELLRRTCETCLGAYTYQDIPFEKLVEELQPERDTSRTPLFQVMFQLQNAPREQLELPGVTLDRFPYGHTIAKFDLSLSMSETGSGLKASWEYATDLFEATTIQKMVKHFQVLLEGIVANPDQRISELPLLTEEERHQQLVEWNDTEADYPRDQCVHQLFEAQVEKTPNAVALVYEDQHVSYRELNRRANQLAHYLRKLGVGPEVLVGLCLERSPEMIIALLGILKAGGAYVPLDPEYPQERLHFMLEDAAALVLITHSTLIGNLLEHDARIIRIDEDWPTIVQESDQLPLTTVMTENLAYVIYTSGSTGRPKGVAIEHNSLINLVAWHQREYGVTSADRATQVAAFTFDASVWELWPHLTAGTSIIIPNEETRLRPSRIFQWMVAERITLSFLPTPLAEIAIQAPWPENIALRFLLTGGDKLRHRPPQQILFEVINHYGPTENTVVTTSCPVTAEIDGERSPLIGHPLPNMQVFIVDHQLHPVPVGVGGQIQIAGDGLARGYIYRPDLTAGHFIPNPFSGQEGKRLYQTGDLARFLAEGNIEFLGRMDYQVKILGNRIELGEIETVLAEHPDVSEVVVLAQESNDGGQQLVAHLTTHRSTSTLAIKRFLRDRLPRNMVPAYFVFDEEFKLTSSGKIDRCVLSTLEQPPASGQSFVSPQTPTEETIARIWRDVLGIEQVGRHDNFFDLGGHSLQSVILLDKIEKELKVKIQPREILLQTLGQLAVSVDKV